MLCQWIHPQLTHPPMKECNIVVARNYLSPRMVPIPTPENDIRSEGVVSLLVAMIFLASQCRHIQGANPGNLCYSRTVPVARGYNWSTKRTPPPIIRSIYMQPRASLLVMTGRGVPAWILLCSKIAGILLPLIRLTNQSKRRLTGDTAELIPLR